MSHVTGDKPSVTQWMVPTQLAGPTPPPVILRDPIELYPVTAHRQVLQDHRIGIGLPASPFDEGPELAYAAGLHIRCYDSELLEQLPPPFLVRRRRARAVALNSCWRAFSLCGSAI